MVCTPWPSREICSTNLVYKFYDDTADSEKVCFVVEWCDEPDHDTVVPRKKIEPGTVVPRKKIESKPPFPVGGSVCVKATGSRGQSVKYDGKILSKG